MVKRKPKKKIFLNQRVPRVKVWERDRALT
jgi:hypothetical protein